MVPVRGLTTTQILASPPDSLYIALDVRNVLYCKSLAAHLGRRDLEVAHRNYLARCSRILLNRKKVVVIDHAVWIEVHLEAMTRSDRQDFWRGYHQLRSAGLIFSPFG